MSMDKTAFMQSLFKLMGKAVRILRTDGSMTEGIIKGVLLDGAEMITIHGVEKVPYEEIENLSGFAVEVKPAEKVPEAKKNYPTTQAAFSDLEKDILEGNKDALLTKLSDSAIHKTSGLSKNEAEEMLKRARGQIPWDAASFHTAYRYQHILEAKADKEVLEKLCLTAIKEEPKSRNKAMFLLFRILVKQERYEEIISLYEKYQGGVKETDFAIMQVYATAIGYVRGEEPLRKFIQKKRLTQYAEQAVFFERLLKKIGKEQAELLTAEGSGENGEELFSVLEADIFAGRKDDTVAKLKNPLFRSKTETLLKNPMEVLKRAEQKEMQWGNGPTQAVNRYKAILKENARYESLVTYLEDIIRQDEQAKQQNAVKELLLIYRKEKKYAEILSLFEAYVQEDEEKAYSQMTAYAVAIAYVRGEEAFRAYLEAHPGLAEHGTNKQSFVKVLAAIQNGGKDAAENAEACGEKTAVTEDGTDPALGEDTFSEMMEMTEKVAFLEDDAEKAEETEISSALEEEAFSDEEDAEFPAFSDEEIFVAPFPDEMQETIFISEEQGAINEENEAAYRSEESDVSEKDKDTYFETAVKSGKEEDYLALYDHLYQTEDSDAPLLAAFMIYNSSIWNSGESRRAFEALCAQNHLTDVGETLVSAFGEALDDTSPDAALLFLKKWNPVTEREPQRAIRSLSRVRQETGSAEIVSMMAMAFELQEAWRRLAGIYKERGMECEGNILYSIACTSRNLKDLYILQNFARNNRMTVLYTAASLLRMEWEPHNTATVRNAARALGTLAQKSEEAPRDFVCRIFEKISVCAGRNAEPGGELLYAGQLLAIGTDTAEAFLETCMPELSAQPKSLIAFMLELYMRCPWKAAICEKVRRLLVLTEAFPGKNLALKLAENPGGLWQHGVNKSAAAQLLLVVSGLNVHKMHNLIFDAILDTEENGIAPAVGGMRLLLAQFPKEGLLHEAMYYLLAADGDEKNAAEMYTALYGYLLLTRTEPKLFVHFAKRLYSGFLYLKRKNITCEGAPKTEEELQAFFDSINQDVAYREEFISFKRRLVLMATENMWYDALLFAGMSGNWRPFMELEEALPGRVLSEVDMFIHDVGRYNFLRSLASGMISGMPRRHLEGFLSETERMQTDAIAAVNCGGEDKRTALRLLKCTTLDKTSSEVLAEKLFRIITPESFGLLMPVMRLLMLDSVLVETLREQKDAFLAEAAETIVEQRETVPGQILGKTYRDFLRAMVNLLFDRGLYREASPIYGILFTTDEEAARHNAENRYTNITHAVLRQRQKFCDLVTRDPETVDKFRTTDEYAKLINIFAVHFASTRPRDIEKIEPIMTVLQKKLCAAVLYAAGEEYEKFERLGAEIWKENPNMGEVLFAYGDWKIREERWKERFKKYLPKEQDEENRLFFISPRANPVCAKLPILQLLGLSDSPQDGREAHATKAAPVEEAPKARRHIRAEEFAEMPIAAYARLNAGNAETLAYCREALAQYEKEPSFKTGTAVLCAKDFMRASEALLRVFCGSFALYVFMEAEERGEQDNTEFVPNVFACLSSMTQIAPRDTEVFCDVMERILLTLQSPEEYSFYFTKHAAHIKMLLSSAKNVDEERKNAILLYFEAAESLVEIDPQGDGKKALDVICLQKQAVAQHNRKYGGGSAEMLIEALDFLINEAEEMLREQPLLSIRTDTDAVSCGNLFTGYVENSGMAPAEEAVLKITYANGETHGVQMRRLFGNYKAPFAFPMPGKEGDKVSATLLLTYIYEGEERRLRKTIQDIEILPREEYALNALPGMAISADEVEKYFIGRTEEIRSFENEFYRLEPDAEGKVRRTVRPPREVPVMVMNGPKRVGKSSLLHCVEKIVRELPDEWVAVHFDAQYASDMREVFVKALSLNWKIDGKSILEHPAYADIEAMLPKDDSALSILELGRYYEALRDTFAPGKKIFYLIDEIERVMQICTPEVLLNMLQYALKNLNHVISFLICGSDDLTNYMFEMENKTQFFQLAKTCAVGKMPKHEYRQLLEGFANRTGLYPDEEAKEALWLLTRGQIYYTHLIFNQLVDLYRSRPVLCTRRDMRLFDVYYAFDRLHGGSEMFSGLSTMFDRYQSGEKEVIETVASYSMTPGEGITLERLQKRSGIENVEKAVTRLEARGFLTFQGGKYMLSSEMYRVAFGKYATATLYFRN